MAFLGVSRCPGCQRLGRWHFQPWKSRESPIRGRCQALCPLEILWRCPKGSMLMRPELGCSLEPLGSLLQMPCPGSTLGRVYCGAWGVVEDPTGAADHVALGQALGAQVYLSLISRRVPCVVRQVAVSTAHTPPCPGSRGQAQDWILRRVAWETLQMLPRVLHSSRKGTSPSPVRRVPEPALQGPWLGGFPETQRSRQCLWSGGRGDQES